jgi:hypothetical protein
MTTRRSIAHNILGPGFIVLLASGLLLSCKKELDAPPERTLPVGSVMTVAELRELFQGEPVRFPEDKSVFAVVTADEENGNLYRNIFVQDHTGAIQLRLQNPGGLYQGDSIRIYLPGKTGPMEDRPVQVLRFARDWFLSNPSKTGYKGSPHFWLGEGVSNHFFDDVTHWMPLPTAPAL